MKCPNCGNEVSAKAVQCRRCGLILPGTSYTHTNIGSRAQAGGNRGFTEHIGGASYYPGYTDTRTSYAGPTYTYPVMRQEAYPDPYAVPSASYYYERAARRDREKMMFYSKILTTLLSLHVVLDLLLIVILFLR